MTWRFLGSDPLEAQVDAVLSHLAGEMARVANTPGGGALVLGVAGHGQRIGANPDAHRLRHRIWELTAGNPTVGVRVVGLAGARWRPSGRSDLIGDTLVVTSPGGLMGGIRPANIITHPAGPRYRSLAEVRAALRLAEREGIGVDRMVRDTLAAGHHSPAITEIPGPYVRVGLIGDDPDPDVLALPSAAEPTDVAADVDAPLVMEHLGSHGRVDIDPATTPPIVAIAGVPAHRLGDTALGLLATRTTAPVPSTGALPANLEDDGHLAPGRATRMGRGFLHIPTEAGR